MVDLKGYVMRKQGLSVIIDKRFRQGLLVASAILLGSVPQSTARHLTQGQQWSRFRGPNGQGISYAENIPIKWTEKDYNWKVTLPGTGHSSPVIWQDKYL